MWGRPAWQVFLWNAVELLVVSNHWQPSTKIRAKALRAFGAHIGQDTVLRPFRVKFPWKLSIGDRSWIGYDVWFSNEGQVTIGNDCVISQGTFVTSGTHDYKRDMALISRPITLEDGVWITAKCVVLPGAYVGKSALALPGTAVRGVVPPKVQVSGPACEVIGPRTFEDEPIVD